MQERKAVPSALKPVAQSSIPVRGLRVPDAAAYAGVAHWHIRTAVWTGRLKAHRAGKVIIILREDLDRYLSSLPEVQPLKSDWLAVRQAKVNAA